MSKFYLYYNGSLHISPIDCPAEPYNILASRDPDEPVEFKAGYAYFNPVLKSKDANELFLGKELIGYYSGRYPAKLTKAETKQADRCWFELAPRNIRVEEIPPELKHRIQAVPKLTGVIVQLLRSQLGLRVPADLAFNTSKEWFDWILAQQMAVPPQVKEIFRRQSGKPVCNAKIREHMITGREPEPLIIIKARWVKVKSVTTVTSRLYESDEYEMAVQKKLTEGGAQAILAEADKQWGKDWKTVGDYVTGLDRLETSAETIQEGALIFYKPENAPTYALLHEPDFRRPDSIIDMIGKTIETHEKLDND